MKITILHIAICALLSFQRLIAATGGKSLTLEQIRMYSDIQEKLYPDKGSLYKKLKKAFPGTTSFTPNEILAVEKPDISEPYDYKDKHNRAKNRTAENILRDSFSAETTRQTLAVYENRNPGSKGLWDALVLKYGRQPWYMAEELRDVEENGTKSKTLKVPRPKDDPIGTIVSDIEKRQQNHAGFGVPLIRENWRDVLYKEDRSQADREKQTLDDLIGATLSYSHDGRAHADTWSAKGAVIFPWQRGYPLTREPFSLQRLAFAPSVSIDRNDTNGNASTETDSMLFRLGAYADIFLGNVPSRKRPDKFQDLRGTDFNIQVRAAGVYATDTKFGARLPGFEIDLEPQIDFRPFPFGYRKVWIEKAPLKEGGTDNSLFETQLRVWLHMEGGDVQNTGSSWDMSKGTFFRLGPSVELQAKWPKLAFGRDMSFTALGSYLGSVSGSNTRPYYYKLSWVYDLFKSEEPNRKVSINANYENGGLNFTKENVDRFTIGLGILF